MKNQYKFGDMVEIHRHGNVFIGVVTHLGNRMIEVTWKETSEIERYYYNSDIAQYILPHNPSAPGNSMEVRIAVAVLLNGDYSVTRVFDGWTDDIVRTRLFENFFDEVDGGEVCEVSFVTARVPKPVASKITEVVGKVES